MKKSKPKSIKYDVVDISNDVEEEAPSTQRVVFTTADLDEAQKVLQEKSREGSHKITPYFIEDTWNEEAPTRKIEFPEQWPKEL